MFFSTTYHPHLAYCRRRVFLRKDSYIPKLWEGFSFPYLKKKQTTNITIQLSKHDQEKYVTSFLKKRILTAWKEQRCAINTPVNYSNTIEKQLYQNTYNRLKPLLLASYTEDFKQPYTEFAFRSWLQYVKILAQITGKYRDARYWEELSRFIASCTQHNLVDL